jgi:amino acid transporter
MGMAVFLFVGFEWVTPMGKRPDSYQRLLPLSMPAAIIVLAVLYVVFSTAFLHTAPQQHSLNAPQLSLGDALFGRAGVMVMMGLSLLAMLTSFNAGLMGAARLVYGIAREGHLPKMCSRISLNTCAPVGAIAALGGVSLLAALVAGFYQLHLAMAVVAAVITAMVYGAVIFAMLVLRRQSHHKPAIFRNPMPAPVLWVTGALFVLLAPATLVTDSPPYSGLLLAAITVLAGLLSRWSKFEALWQTRWVKDTPI